MSSRDDNIATQEKAAERLNAGDVDAGVDIMFAPDAVDHDPAPFQEQGREGFRRFLPLPDLRFPGLHHHPGADGGRRRLDRVRLHTLTGTHQGEFEGVAPTGSRIEVRGLQLGRFENGQIVERWGATDMATLVPQIQA